MVVEALWETVTKQESHAIARNASYYCEVRNYGKRSTRNNRKLNIHEEGL